MLLSLAFIFIFGYIGARFFSFLKLPDIIGMIFAGVFLNHFNLLDEKIINISAELREIALVIILTRAGLSLEFDKLKKVGRPAILMSFIPACFEILAIVLMSIFLFDIPILTALILGTTVAAVSPAVIVPRMIKLQEEGYGKKKNISELILASASVDDIFVLVLFYSFLSANDSNIYLLPLNIVLGVIVGIIVALLLVFLFKKFKISVNHATILMLSTSFVLLFAEDFLHFSALLAIMTIGMMILRKMPDFSSKLSQSFSSLWSGAMIILFVLVGFSLNLEYALSEGIKPVILILFVLIFRCLGAYLCVLKTNLNQKERLFCVISYVPKATVQAAIGGIPLSQGLPYGELILTISVVSILITAPIGAFLIDFTYKKLLKKD